MLVAPVPMQRFGNLLLAGVNAGVLQVRQRMTVAFAGNDATHDLLARFTDDVGNHVSQSLPTRYSTLAHGKIARCFFQTHCGQGPVTMLMPGNPLEIRHRQN